VVHLTGADFDKAVKRKKHSLIMFYAPWCGHCKKAKPEFTDAAEQLAENNKV
jgi:thiol-disulfide isomerase/thioredoxin